MDAITLFFAVFNVLGGIAASLFAFKIYWPGSKTPEQLERTESFALHS